jgi:hypothetical protein
MKKRLYALAGAAALVLAMHPVGAFAMSNDHPDQVDVVDQAAGGSVTVTKSVTGTLAPSDPVLYEISLLDGDGQAVGTQYVADGHSVTWDGLEPGTYSLHEGADPAYTATWWPSSTVVVDAEHHAHSVTLTNDFGDGSITLTKTVEGEIAPPGAAFSFAVVPDGSSVPKEADIRVLHDGESTTWGGLTAGTYRIVELTTGRFTPTWSPSDVVTIDTAHHHADVLVTNDYGERYTGWISVTKQVAGGLAPSDGAYEIRLERWCEEGWLEVGTHTVAAGGTVTWYGLRHGTYRAVEATTGSFTTSWSPDDDIVLDDLHESAAVTVTNDYGDPVVPSTTTTTTEAPTTTVGIQSVSPTTLAPTTTTRPSTTTTTAAPAPTDTVVPAIVSDQAEVGDQLAFTGSSGTPLLAGIGFGAAALGAALLGYARRQRSRS